MLGHRKLGCEVRLHVVAHQVATILWVRAERHHRWPRPPQVILVPAPHSNPMFELGALLSGEMLVSGILHQDFRNENI